MDLGSHIRNSALGVIFFLLLIGSIQVKPSKGTEWYVIESWSGSLFAGETGWFTVEAWHGRIANFWYIVEKWTGTIIRVYVEPFIDQYFPLMLFIVGFVCFFLPLGIIFWKRPDPADCIKLIMISFIGFAVLMFSGV